MEVSDVRRRVLDTIDRARRGAAARRVRADEAAVEYAAFLENIALPLFRQVANVLKVENYAFTLFTPGGGVRLTSDRHAEDFIELSLDTTGEQPAVIGHAKRARGGRIIETEAPIGDGAIRDLSEEHVLRFLLKELTPMVEK